MFKVNNKDTRTMPLAILNNYILWTIPFLPQLITLKVH